jgi:hypothetical protein
LISALVRLARVCHGPRMEALATVLIIAVMIFVTAFPLGLWCRRRRRWSQAGLELKRRARA